MKHARLFVCLGVLVVSAAPALAKPAYVPSTVNLRAAPGTTSEIVGKIPGGSLIDAGECSEGWCEVTWQEKKGFAIKSALDLSGRVPRQATRVQPYRTPAYRAAARPAYGPDDGYVAMDEPVYAAPPPPGYYYGPYYRPYWGWRRRGW